MNVRRATTNDEAAIRALYGAEWPTYHFDPVPGEIDFVAEHEGRLVGVVRFVPEHGGLVRRGRVVLPAFRKHGIGAALLAAVHCEAAGRPYFSASTIESAGQSKKYGCVRLDQQSAKDLLQSYQTLEALAKRIEQYHREEDQRYVLLFHPGNAAHN
jgi:GNAT superfamily N-acetyltransferase